MHIDYPFRVDGRGRTATASRDDHVRALIEQVLFTAPGERVNRPSFGSGVRQLVFEPTGAEAATATELLVQSALQQWLSGLVEVQGVDVSMRDSTLTVTVRYRAARSPDPQTAVFTRPA